MSALQAIGHLPVEAILAGLINNEEGLPKIKLLEVTPTTAGYFDDPLLEMGKDELFRALLDIDGSGDLALRVGFHSSSGSTPYTRGGLSTEQLIRSVIGKTAEGKPYLRLTMPTN